jgi:hypothetical protein
MRYAILHCSESLEGGTEREREREREREKRVKCAQVEKKAVVEAPAARVIL